MIALLHKIPLFGREDAEGGKTPLWIDRGLTRQLPQPVAVDSSGFSEAADGSAGRNERADGFSGAVPWGAAWGGLTVCEFLSFILFSVENSMVVCMY